MENNKDIQKLQDLYSVYGKENIDIIFDKYELAPSHNILISYSSHIINSLNSFERLSAFCEWCKENEHSFVGRKPQEIDTLLNMFANDIDGSESDEEKYLVLYRNLDIRLDDFMKMIVDLNDLVTNMNVSVSDVVNTNSCVLDELHKFSSGEQNDNVSLSSTEDILSRVNDLAVTLSGISSVIMPLKGKAKVESSATARQVEQYYTSLDDTLKNTSESIHNADTQTRKDISDLNSKLDALGDIINSLKLEMDNIISNFSTSEEKSTKNIFDVKSSIGMVRDNVDRKPDINYVTNYFIGIIVLLVIIVLFK